MRNALRRFYVQVEGYFSTYKATALTGLKP